MIQFSKETNFVACAIYYNNLPKSGQVTQTIKSHPKHQKSPKTTNSAKTTKNVVEMQAISTQN